MSALALTLTTQQLAELLQTHPHSIRAFRAGLRSPALLAGLPEPMQAQPRLVWLRADIEAWLDSRRTFRFRTGTDTHDAPAVSRRGPGRPRKTGSAS